MSTQVTLTLPDDVAATVATVAQRRGTEVQDIVAELLQSFFGESSPLAELHLTTLTNDQVIALADGAMPERQSDRLSLLLQSQSARKLLPYEMAERDALMHFYINGCFIKTHALMESTKRGIPAPQPDQTETARP